MISQRYANICNVLTAGIFVIPEGLKAFESHLNYLNYCFLNRFLTLYFNIINLRLKFRAPFQLDSYCMSSKVKKKNQTLALYFSRCDMPMSSINVQLFCTLLLNIGLEIIFIFNINMHSNKMYKQL